MNLHLTNPVYRRKSRRHDDARMNESQSLSRYWWLNGGLPRFEDYDDVKLNTLLEAKCMYHLYIIASDSGAVLWVDKLDTFSDDRIDAIRQRTCKGCALFGQRFSAFLSY